MPFRVLDCLNIIYMHNHMDMYFFFNEYGMINEHDMLGLNPMFLMFRYHNMLV